MIRIPDSSNNGSYRVCFLLGSECFSLLRWQYITLHYHLIIILLTCGFFFGGGDGSSSDSSSSSSSDSSSSSSSFSLSSSSSSSSSSLSCSAYHTHHTLNSSHLPTSSVHSNTWLLALQMHTHRLELVIRPNWLWSCYSWTKKLLGF